MKTTVVHRKREPFDVLISQPSKWGNPFQIGRHGTREQVIAKYARWIVTQPALLLALPELRGKRLACWCTPYACHGDILAALADALGPHLAQADRSGEAGETRAAGLDPQGESTVGREADDAPTLSYLTES